MFELLFAWTVFTLVLGKSAEAVTHAWKGTAPPGHLRRMARIRAREAAAHRRDLKPSEGFRGWARTVWADSWNAAAERHKERWPQKAEKKLQRARQRWAWWDHVEDEAGRRWDKRRAERDAASPKEPQEPGAQGGGPTGEGEGRGEEDAPPSQGSEPKERPETPDRAGDGGSSDSPDAPDSTPETAGEGQDEGVRDPRTPGQPPVSGGASATDSDGGSDDMAEVMNLSGCTKFTRALNKTYSDSTQTLEEILAWLHSQNITSGRLHDRFSEILNATVYVNDLTEKALEACEAQLRVRDAIEAAGGTALSKEALLTS